MIKEVGARERNGGDAAHFRIADAAEQHVVRYPQTVFAAPEHRTGGDVVRRAEQRVRPVGPGEQFTRLFITGIDGKVGRDEVAFARLKTCLVQRVEKAGAALGTGGPVAFVTPMQAGRLLPRAIMSAVSAFAAPRSSW